MTGRRTGRKARCPRCGRDIDTVIRRGREQLAPHPWDPDAVDPVGCHGGNRPVDEISPRRTR